MLDTYLGIAYERSLAEQAEADLFATMSKLPIEELYKIAQGEKLAYGGGLEWLEQYKGTPLFDQAVGLEQKAIQLQMADRQEREQDRLISDQREQLCMEKKLLDLQLATFQQQQLTGAPPPAAGPAPAAAPPPPAPGGEAGAGPATDPANPKSVTVKMGMDNGASSGPLTTREKALAFGFGNLPGYLGAKKGKEHSGEALQGGVRGALGYVAGGGLGSLVGGGLGAVGGAATGAVGGALAGADNAAIHRLARIGALTGGVGGGLFGGAVGGVGGYKLLTHKYDKKPDADHRDAPPPTPDEGREITAEVHQAVTLAQQLARADHEKIAEAQRLLETGVLMGKTMAKTALNPAGLFGQAKGLAGQAAGAIGNFAKSNPTVALGAAGGALGGVVAGSGKDEHGQRSVGKMVGGGLLGAATGGVGAHAGQSIAQSMAGGTPIGTAAKHYANHWGQVLHNTVSRAAPAASAPAQLTG